MCKLKYVVKQEPPKVASFSSGRHENISVTYQCLIKTIPVTDYPGFNGRYSQNRNNLYSTFIPEISLTKRTSLFLCFYFFFSWNGKGNHDKIEGTYLPSVLLLIYSSFWSIKVNLQNKTQINQVSVVRLIPGLFFVPLSRIWKNVTKFSHLPLVIKSRHKHR